MPRQSQTPHILSNAEFANVIVNLLHPTHLCMLDVQVIYMTSKSFGKHLARAPPEGHPVVRHWALRMGMKPEKLPALLPSLPTFMKARNAGLSSWKPALMSYKYVYRMAYQQACIFCGNHSLRASSEKIHSRIARNARTYFLFKTPHSWTYEVGATSHPLYVSVKTHKAKIWYNSSESITAFVCGLCDPAHTNQSTNLWAYESSTKKWLHPHCTGKAVRSENPSSEYLKWATRAGIVEERLVLPGV